MGLVAWRYFNPLPPKPPVAAPDAPKTKVATSLELDHLLNSAVDQATIVMLSSLIQLADSPEVTESGAEWDAPHKGKRWYLGYVRQELGAGTFRHSEFDVRLNQAEWEAEQKIEATPPDQRPSGIDPLKLRRREILDLQFTRAIQFLKNEKREVEERIIAQRHRLIEMLQRRS